MGEPLVSVAIITYNSAATIVDTLNSINRQTYKNIELIISDDASDDNTVNICNTWLEKHCYRFTHIKLITVPKNTGVTGNCERALEVASGSWFKVLAGDDLLTDDSIQEYISFVQSNSQAKVVLSDYYSFSEGNNLSECHREFLPLRKVFYANNVTAYKQFNILSKMFVGYGPTFFVSIDCMQEVGGYDQRFPMQEDHALFIKLTKAGHKIHLIQKPLVYYRIAGNSISHQSESYSIYNKCLVRYLKEYKYAYLLENSNKIWRYLIYFSMFLRNKVIDSGNDKRKALCIVYHFIERLFSPLMWYERIIRRYDSACIKK